MLYESCLNHGATSTAADSEAHRHKSGSATDPRRRFQLRNVLSREVLYSTADLLQSAAGQAAGADGVSPTELTRRELGTMSGELSKRIRQRKYRPGPRRAVPIDKPTGGKRTLTIPNFADRVVARSVVDIVQPLVDPLLATTSYGFRPNRSTWLMLAQLKATMERFERWVIVNCDIYHAFESVRIDAIMRAFRQLLGATEFAKSDVRTQQRFLKLIETILQGGVKSRNIGIGTGCPLSPLALNALLHTNHDLHLAEETTRPFLVVGDVEGFRYADNLVYLAKSVADGRELLRDVHRHFDRLALPLKEDGEVCDLRNNSEPPTLLGFNLRCEDCQLVFDLSDRAVDKLAQHLEQAHCSANPTLTAHQAVNGWISYCGPAFQSGRECLPQIARLLTDYGFRERCTVQALEEQWLASGRRWRKLLSEVELQDLLQFGPTWTWDSVSTLTDAV